MTLSEISLLFGVVPSVASDTISSMLSVVHNSLKKNPSARIKFPSYLELVSYANMISRRTPQVQNVVGFIDYKKTIIATIFLLHNYRAKYLGLNQITKLFNPEYKKYINIDGYDRIKI